MTERTHRTDTRKVSDEELDHFIKTHLFSIAMLCTVKKRFKKGLDIDDWECHLAEELLRGIVPPTNSPYYSNATKSF